ncbi:MAG: type II toxin-antitoxin system RelE/ParE family toxin [bacterium]|nr:type II toxin-antitoxin system RelE/ParE family toxin [bacterium]
MSYLIELVPEARSEIKALPGYDRAQAIELIEALADHPRPLRARELRAEINLYRIWLAGRWRIAYRIDDQNERIIILRLRRKERIDYDTLSSWMNKSDSDASYDVLQ